MRYCRACGAQLSVDAAFCSGCGAAQQAAEPDAVAGTAADASGVPSRRAPRKVLVAFIAVAAIIVIVVVGVVVIVQQRAAAEKEYVEAAGAITEDVIGLYLSVMDSAIQDYRDFAPVFGPVDDELDSIEQRLAMLDPPDEYASMHAQLVDTVGRWHSAVGTAAELSSASSSQAEWAAQAEAVQMASMWQAADALFLERMPDVADELAVAVEESTLLRDVKAELDARTAYEEEVVSISLGAGQQLVSTYFRVLPSFMTYGDLEAMKPVVDRWVSEAEALLDRVLALQPPDDMIGLHEDLDRMTRAWYAFALTMQELVYTSEDMSEYCERFVAWPGGDSEREAMVSWVAVVKSVLGTFDAPDLVAEIEYQLAYLESNTWWNNTDRTMVWLETAQNSSGESGTGGYSDEWDDIAGSWQNEVNSALGGAYVPPVLY